MRHVTRTTNSQPARVADSTFVPSPALGTRTQPAADGGNSFFWDGLAHGELVVLACGSCDFGTPYGAVGCPSCDGRLHLVSLTPRGVLYSFTVCYQSFGVGLVPPYIVAVVDVDRQHGIRLVSNLVNVVISDVRVGMPVNGLFEPGPPALLLFEPA